MNNTVVKKIISGGQSGVDRAALDFAIKSQIEHGGWCPRGRIAEKNETIPYKYNLIETISDGYAERTKINVEKSDGTLILVDMLPLKEGSGTSSTVKIAASIDKPVLIIDIYDKVGEYKKSQVIEWLTKHNIEILNVAGPKESSSNGIYKKAFSFLEVVFTELCQPNQSQFSLPRP